MFGNLRKMTARQKLAIVPALAVAYGILTGFSHLVVFIGSGKTSDVNEAIHYGFNLGVLFVLLLWPMVSKVVQAAFDRIGGKAKTTT